MRYLRVYRVKLEAFLSHVSITGIKTPGAQDIRTKRIFENFIQTILSILKMSAIVTSIVTVRGFPVFTESQKC